MVSNVLKGAVSGAAGTAALNAVTYLDMAIRARPASPVPEKDVQKLADMAGVELSKEGNGDRAANRRQALGSLLGFATGIGVGAIYGALRPRMQEAPLPVAASGLGLAAMAGSDVPSTLLGATNPKTWDASSWAADIVPHLAYGLATAAVYEALNGGK